MEALDNTRESVRINHELIRKIKDVKDERGINVPRGFQTWFKNLFKR